VNTCSFDPEVLTVPESRPPYPTEPRSKLVGLAGACRPAPEIAEQFGPAAQSIRNWIAQADRAVGSRTDGATNAEHVHAPAGRDYPAVRADSASPLRATAAPE
jgi:hypothetical protein